MFWVYILQSITTGKYYIGHTSNLEQRVMEHNLGKSLSTRNRGPYKLVHNERFISKAEATRRELQIKSYKTGRAFKNLISG